MKNEEPESELLDFDHPSYRFEPKQIHGWHQQGFYLVCKTCEITHAVFIGPKKLMVGINKDGTPKLVNR